MQELVCVSGTVDKLLFDVEGAGVMRRFAPPRRETATSFMDSGSWVGLRKLQQYLAPRQGFVARLVSRLQAKPVSSHTAKFAVPARLVSQFKILKGCARIDVRAMCYIWRVMNSRSFSVSVGFIER